MSIPKDRARYLSSWNDLEELSAVQNHWLRKYTKPSVAVILEEWAKDQPSNFALDYLLNHAIHSDWDLTEEGWKKAGELGIVTPLEKSPEKLSADDDEDDDENWLTHAEAAKQLLRETSDTYSFEALKSKLSKLASKGKIATNGKKYRKIRFLKSAIDTLELKLRNDILAADSYLDDSDDD